MAEPKSHSLEEFGRAVGEMALDEFEYKGLTLREWIEKIIAKDNDLMRRERWCCENRRDEHGRIIYHCSGCNFEVRVFPYMVGQWTKNEQYCPCCGAYMHD